MIMKKTDYLGEGTADLLYFMLQTNRVLGMTFRIEPVKFGTYSLTPEFENVDTDGKQNLASLVITTFKDHMFDRYDEYFYAATAYSVIKHQVGSEVTNIEGLALSAKGKFVNLYFADNKTLRVDMCDKRVKSSVNELMQQN